MNILKKIKDSYRKHKETMQCVSDDEILVMARDNNGRITASGLARQTPLTYFQASIKLQHLLNQGYLEMTYTAGGNQILILKESEAKRLQSVPPTRSLKLTDAKVLQAVVEAGGKATAASLCIILECSIDEARKKLDELQLKNVFDLEVTDKGSIRYVLNDMECFQQTKLKKIV